jgi:hypothetical protein
MGWQCQKDVSNIPERHESARFVCNEALWLKSITDFNAEEMYRHWLTVVAEGNGTSKSENGAMCRRCCAVVWLRPRASTVKKTNSYKQEQSKAPRKKGKGIKKHGKKEERMGGGRRRKVHSFLYIRQTNTNRKVPGA